MGPIIRIKEAVEKSRNGKPVGIDHISAELLKSDIRTSTSQLYHSSIRSKSTVKYIAIER